MPPCCATAAAPPATPSPPKPRAGSLFSPEIVGGNDWLPNTVRGMRLAAELSSCFLSRRGVSSVCQEEFRMIDEIDRQILLILQQNARTSNAEIARQIDMAPSAVLERIRRLESRGVIQGYEARINPEALGLGVLAFVFVRSADFDGEAKTAELLSRIPEVQE